MKRLTISFLAVAALVFLGCDPTDLAEKSDIPTVPGFACHDGSLVTDPADCPPAPEPEPDPEPEPEPVAESVILSGSCNGSTTVPGTAQARDESRTIPPGHLKRVRFEIIRPADNHVVTQKDIPVGSQPRTHIFAGIPAGTYICRHSVRSDNPELPESSHPHEITVL